MPKIISGKCFQRPSGITTKEDFYLSQASRHEHCNNPEQDFGVIEWANGRIPVIKSPNKANVRIVKRKESFTEWFTAKKKRVTNGDDVNDHSQSQYSAAAEPLGTEINEAVEKALHIFEKHDRG
ncbi:hypothetical protein BWQ96_05606 [Gracilariopsis chorda]|uniref:Uncharacterized protein n=1 Tax=Gracilariopsis chorda TaxID=448386 RepID=A0A2V3IR58_9FLOR|nr:hypothetical protein BWQ96_05606 [Gracilariopsis chorda]|eukprot:PXF44611.1 hypothetical protein BWQ96_05606 [Gracilariopsis chorda]